MTLGLIREGKVPADNRVALTPGQCKMLQKQFPQLTIKVQTCPTRCYTDKEYRMAGIEVVEDLSDCAILLGIKEVPVNQLLAEKTYLFFSHTKKKQAHNQVLLQTILKQHITLIDFECLEHSDGQRIIGFGFFAGVVGAHNGMMAYGNRTGSYQLERVFKQKSFRKLIHAYFGLKLPNIKIGVTGSGRVAHGIVEVMNLMGIIEVEKEEYRSRSFEYPVYVQLKGADLYAHKEEGSYNRDHFHEHPEQYRCLFPLYTSHTDILLNGVYWDQNLPRLFERESIQDSDFRISVISDITDDENGSVPINLGDQSIADPVYGVSRSNLEKTKPYQPGSIDVVAVGNLPNELPRDASRYFGEQLIKFVLPELLDGGSDIIDRATIVRNGVLTPAFAYLHDYATAGSITA
ncbi:alanine dehydrogenase [Cnuella takakiae]|nr:alanine dehydrogenase [Cnuella takakiae]